MEGFRGVCGYGDVNSRKIRNSIRTSNKNKEYFCEAFGHVFGSQASDDLENLSPPRSQHRGVVFHEHGLNQGASMDRALRVCESLKDFHKDDIFVWPTFKEYT